MDEAATWPAGVRRMIAAATARDLAVAVRPRPAARSLAEAARLLGVTPADIAKTMVVRMPGERYLLAVLAGDRQISWPRLRAIAGVNKMTLPDADEALRVIGYPRGTITPVGALGEWPIVIDRGLAGRRVAMGSGDPGFSAFLAVDDLAEAYGAQVVDIAE